MTVRGGPVGLPATRTENEVSHGEGWNSQVGPGEAGGQGRRLRQGCTVTGEEGGARGDTSGEEGSTRASTGGEESSRTRGTDEEGGTCGTGSEEGGGSSRSGQEGG